MKVFCFVIVILVLSGLVNAQSGRRATRIVVPVPSQPVETSGPTPKPQQDDGPEVTAERNQDYRCTEDGTLARIIDTEGAEPQVFSSKEVDTRVTILSKPNPSYTKEARRNGVQGFVVLRTLLSADGRVDRIRVMKRLPAGLTENAIHAACKIKFKPATKGGQAVAQLVTLEYVFRLAHSSIFGP